MGSDSGATKLGSFLKGNGSKRSYREVVSERERITVIKEDDSTSEREPIINWSVLSFFPLR